MQFIANVHHCAQASSITVTKSGVDSHALLVARYSCRDVCVHFVSLGHVVIPVVDARVQDC